MPKRALNINEILHNVLSREDEENLDKKLKAGDLTPLQSKQGKFSRFMFGDRTDAVNKALLQAQIQQVLSKQDQEFRSGERQREQLYLSGENETSDIRKNRQKQEEEIRKRNEELRQSSLQGKAQALSGFRDFNAVPSPIPIESATPEQLDLQARINAAKYGTRSLQEGLVSAVPTAEAAAQEAVNQLAQRKAAAPLMSKIGGARAISDLFGAKTSTQANKNRLLNLRGREPFESRIGEQGGQSDLQQTLTDLATGKEKEFASNQNLGIARKLGGLKETTAELKARQEAGDIQDALDQARIARGVTSSPEGQDLQRKIISSKLQSTLFQNRNLPITSNYYQDITGGGWMNPAYSALLQSKVKPDPMEAASSLINQQRALKGLPPLPKVGGIRGPVSNDGSGNTLINPETGEVIYFNP